MQSLRVFRRTTIDLCLLGCTIVSVAMGGETGAFKVHKRICGPGWQPVDTSNPGALTEGSPFLTRAWGQQTLCLKIYKRKASWSEARDTCRQEHGFLMDLDFPGFVAPNMIGILQNVARKVWGEGLRQLWVGMFLSKGKLWWDNPVPLPVQGPNSAHWWEWMEGQPGKRSGDCSRLDIKNGTNDMDSRRSWTPQLGGDQPLFFDAPSMEFRLGVSLINGRTLLPFACVNNGFEFQPSEVGTCSTDWYGSPYLDKCLWFSGDQTATYAGAMETCADKGGHLAMPTTNFYNAYVTKVILHAELGYLAVPDPSDPDDFPNDLLYGDSGAPYSPPQCIFCTDAHTFEKCKPHPDLNGSCPRESVCGVRVMKRSNGSLLYSAGCFVPSECQTITDGSLKHLCHMDEGAYTLCCSAPECLQQLHTLLTEFSCAPKRNTPADGTTGSASEGDNLECFTCEGVSSDEECIQKGSVAKCSAVHQNMSMPVCQTKIWQESRYSRVRIIKGCVNQDLCESARQDCTPLSIAPKCIYCCHDNRCNQWLPSNPIIRPSPVRTTWIGFKKVHNQLVWAGGARGSIATWNASFGSLYRYLPERGCGQLRADRPWGNEWLVDDCDKNLPFICEVDAKITGPVRIAVHPENVTINLQEHLQRNDRLFDPYFISKKHMTLTCEAENYHPHLPVAWVKDGRFYDNGHAPGGFILNVTLEVLYALGMQEDSIHSLQGEYHCEVWDRKGTFRAKSRPATIRFEDVLTFQGSVHLPREEYNTSIHSQATLLFDPVSRAHLAEYHQMVSLLVEFSHKGQDFPSFVNIKAYRPGSLIIDFTVFYELPPVDARLLLKKLGYFSSSITSPSGDWKDYLENHFRVLVLEKIRRRVTNASSLWYKTYGTFGVTSGDITLLSTVACPERYSVRNGRRFRWWRAELGSAARTEQTCIMKGESRPLGVSRCEGDFISGARSARDVYVSNCREKESPLTRELRSISEVAVNSTNIQSISDDLKRLTEDSELLLPADIVYVSRITQNICAAMKVQPPVGRNVLKVITQMMKATKTYIQEAQGIANSSSRLTESVDVLLETLDLGGKAYLSLAEPGMAAHMHNILNSSHGVVGFGVNVRHDHFEGSDVRFLQNRREFNETLQSSGILFPQELWNIIDDIRLNKEAALSRLPGVRPRGLEPWDHVRVTFSSSRPSPLFLPPTPPTGRETMATINSDISSASISGIRVLYLDEPVLTVHKLISRADVSDLLCVYWDYAAANGQGNWSSQGCTIHRSTPDHVVCACTHLTHFAVLKRVELPSKAAIGHQVALSLVNIVGLALSIAGLSLTLLSFIFIRKLRKGNFQKVLANLALALLAADIVYLFGIKRTAVFGTCVAMAALLQYFLTVSFAWILLDALLRYLTAVKVVYAPIEHFVIKVVLPAWGIPLVIVGITAAVDYKLFRGSPKYCWLDDDAFYFGFLLPVAAITVVVSLLFILVIRRIACRDRKSIKSPHQTGAVTYWGVSTSVLCFVLQYFTWILAFFAVEHHNPVFQYLFSVCIALQGISVFVIYCTREQHVRNIWRKLGRCPRNASQRCSDSSASSVGTLSSTLKTSLDNKPTIETEKDIYITAPGKTV